MRYRCCSEHEGDLTPFMIHVVQMLHSIEKRVIMTQASVDAATAAINSLGVEVDDIDAEIQKLKGQGVDTSALEAATASLKTKLDTALTDGAPASTEPVETPEPAPVEDSAPVEDTSNSDTPVGDGVQADTGVDPSQS